MAEPKKLSQKEYDDTRADYEKRYGYDQRSKEEQAEFDKRFDAKFQVEKKADASDTTESTEGKPKEVSKEQYDKLRADFEKKYNYNELSKEKQEYFDKEFDKAVQVKKEGDSDTTDPNDDLDKGKEDEEPERGGFGRGREIDDDDER